MDKGIVLHTNAFRFYNVLLHFYPKIYKKEFGEQMAITFQDMYQEEVASHGGIGIQFWSYVIFDTIVSIISQHILCVKQEGLKKYFHINSYNILGGILLLPFTMLFLFDLIGRVVQGDLNRYNRSFENILSHSFIYANYFGKPLILFAFALFFPIFAVILNVIPFINTLANAKVISTKKLFLANPISFVITLVGLFYLLLILGHDVIPCTMHGMMRFGLGEFGHIVSVCKNA